MPQLHSSAAGSCPLKTHNSYQPGLVAPAPPPRPQWAADHRGFAAAVLAEVVDHNPGVVDLRRLTDLPLAEQEAACLAAMADQAPVIVGGRLPAADHRVGRPDLLVRTPSGYVPGVVRSYRIFDSRGDDSQADLSRLVDLTDRQELPRIRFRWRYRWHLAMRLAHYHRMLESAGYAGPAPLGLVVGDDPVDGLGQVAVWLDLTTPAVPLAGGQPSGPEEEVTSALARYDYEFGLRLEIAEAAAGLPPSPLPQVLPIRTRECETCTWWPLCQQRLDPDDLSLRISKSPLDRHEIAMLREAGVTTVTDLARADLDLLLPQYLPRVGHRKGAEDRVRLAQRRSLLLRDGVQLERIGTDPVDLPVASLEIDLDVETSAEEKVYLWGFWVSQPATGQSEYVEFSDFRPLDEDAEAALAVRALAWLRDRVAGTDALVYHYSGYERDQVERLARAHEDPVLAWAVEFSHQRFVDLFPVVRRHFFGTDGLGLKVVASLGAGFSWRDPDPGGRNSMAWFQQAVSGATAAERDSARIRVLEYNEDDVKATHRVRAWLRSLD